MIDMYTETLVRPKPTSRILLLRLLIVFLTAILIFFSVTICGMYEGMMTFLPIMVIGFGWLGWKFFTYFNYEYEYTVTNGTIDIDQVIAKKSRRRLISMKPDNIETLAPYDERYKSDYDNGEYAKTVDVRSGSGAPAWYIIGSIGDHGRARILFEPTDRMLFIFMQNLPRKMPYLPPLDKKDFL